MRASVLAALTCVVAVLEIADPRLRDPQEGREIETAADEQHGAYERLVRHDACVRRRAGFPRKENHTIR